jgi:hypothetical protein
VYAAEVLTLRKIHQKTLTVLNLVLEKGGEDQLEQTCEERSVTESQGKKGTSHRQ